MSHSLQIDKSFPMIPRRAYLCFPQPQEIKNHKGRKLFEGGLQPDEFQIKKLKEFQDYLNKKRLQLHPFWTDLSRVRFLQSTNWNYEKAYKDMVEHTNWREKLPAPLTPEVEKYLKAGLFYLCGRDCRYRPILVFDLQKIVDMKVPNEALIATITYFFMYIIDNMLISGQIESWVSIIDVNQLGLLSFAGDLKTMIGFLSSTFRSRMHSAYIVRTPGSVGFLWSIVKRFLEEDTIRKISLYAGDERAGPLFTHANPSQIEQKFGGELQNLKHYWPPKIYSMEFEVDGSDAKLISQAEYRKRYKNGELVDRKIDMQLAEPESARRISKQRPSIHKKDSMWLRSGDSPKKLDLNHLALEQSKLLRNSSRRVVVGEILQPVLQQQTIEQNMTLDLYLAKKRQENMINTDKAAKGLFIATPQAKEQSMESIVSQHIVTSRQDQSRTSILQLHSVYQSENPYEILTEGETYETRQLYTRKVERYFIDSYV